MLKNIYLRWVTALVWIIAPILSHAGDLGVGQVASNVMEPVSIMSDFVSTACFVIGAAFLFASLIKFIEHRRSPLMVPISTVIFLLVAGIVLILLPIVSRASESGIQSSLY